MNRLINQEALEIFHLNTDFAGQSVWIDPWSKGNLTQQAKADVLLNYQWYFIPVLFFIALVLAFVFVGDGLRDAADPYSDKK